MLLLLFLSLLVLSLLLLTDNIVVIVVVVIIAVVIIAVVVVVVHVVVVIIINIMCKVHYLLVAFHWNSCIFFKIHKGSGFGAGNNSLFGQVRITITITQTYFCFRSSRTLPRRRARWRGWWRWAWGRVIGHWQTRLHAVTSPNSIS